ncbi:MAG: hypothetical protein LKG11_01180 [Bacilli bacterium]|jgi:hypothetical protein|nr:hypothetical protein [Bacilli bacterium]
MPFEKAMTSESVDKALHRLALEYRKRAERKVRAEIVLLGGAAIITTYKFRESSCDVDADMSICDSCMKEAIECVGEEMGLSEETIAMIEKRKPGK